MSFGKWRPLCLGIKVLIKQVQVIYILDTGREAIPAFAAEVFECLVAISFGTEFRWH